MRIVADTAGQGTIFVELRGTLGNLLQLFTFWKFRDTNIWTENNDV